MAFKSGIKGITYNNTSGYWVATICVAGKARYIKSNKDVVEVAAHMYAVEQCLSLHKQSFTQSFARDYLATQITPITKNLTINDL